MNNKIITFYLLLLLHAIQIYCMDKNTSSKYILFSKTDLTKKINRSFIAVSILKKPSDVKTSNKFKIANSFLLWSTVQFGAYDKLKIKNSLLLGVDIINKYGDKSVPYQNIECQKAIIVSKKQLLIGVGLMFSLYFLRKT